MEKRAPTAADSTAFLPLRHSARKPNAHNAGTISWSEYLLAYKVYSAKYGSGQTAERLAERGGFSYAELVSYLGRDPVTWEPWRKTI